MRPWSWIAWLASAVFFLLAALPPLPEGLTRAGALFYWPMLGYRP